MHTCHICGSLIPYHDYCKKCMDIIPKLPDPKTMTFDQKVAEIRKWGDILEVPWEMYSARIDALIGRHVEMREYVWGADGLTILAQQEEDRRWSKSRSEHDAEWRRICDEDNRRWRQKLAELNKCAMKK